MSNNFFRIFQLPNFSNFSTFFNFFQLLFNHDNKNPGIKCSSYSNLETRRKLDGGKMAQQAPLLPQAFLVLVLDQFLINSLGYFIKVYFFQFHKTVLLRVGNQFFSHLGVILKPFIVVSIITITSFINSHRELYN